MDRLNRAARALAAGDPLAALKLIALDEAAPALALRGIAMAQLGDFARARVLLRSAIRSFGPRHVVERARCIVAAAEIALVSRDLGTPMLGLASARKVLDTHGDHANGAHAAYIDARRLLLIGDIKAATRIIGSLVISALPPASLAGFWLVAAGIAMRRIRCEDAKAALSQAGIAARSAGIPALEAEIAQARRVFEQPVARCVSSLGTRPVTLIEVEALIASDTLVIDACRLTVVYGESGIALSRRPVLFRLVRALAEAWPRDAHREALIRQAFHARGVDDTHRARLRVEIGRLRKELGPAATPKATDRGFTLDTRGAALAVLAPLVEDKHATLLALLGDGEAWSSSSLALALGTGPRAVQRALNTLANAGKVESFGEGRARRWMVPNVPGFPTTLLLPLQTSNG